MNLRMKQEIVWSQARSQQQEHFWNIQARAGAGVQRPLAHCESSVDFFFLLYFLMGSLEHFLEFLQGGWRGMVQEKCPEQC